MSRVSDDDLAMVRRALSSNWVLSEDQDAVCVALLDELAAYRARDLEPRELRAGDVFETPGGCFFVWQDGDEERVTPYRRLLRIPIPSAAAPPAEVKDGAFVFASEAERQAHLGEVQAAHEFKRKCGGLDEAVRGLPAPPQPPEKARAFAEGDRVLARLPQSEVWAPGTVDCGETDGDGAIVVEFDNWGCLVVPPSAVKPLPAEPAEKPVPRVRVPLCGANVTLDMTPVNRAALLRVLQESSERESIRGAGLAFAAALALIGGAQ